MTATVLDDAEPPRGKQAIPTVGVMYSQARFKGYDIALRAYEIAKSEISNLRFQI